MPTYEYACSSCHNEWEQEQSIKDNAVTECPSCHQQTAKRQISRGTGFILKGSGWYADLYSSPSNKPAEGSTKPSGSTGTGSGNDSGSGGSSEGSGSGGDSGSSGSTPASSGSDSGSSAKSSTAATA